MEGFGRTTDGLILMRNGDVEDFDPKVIQQAIDDMPKQGFYEKHCLALRKGDCQQCNLGACPIADQ